MDHIRSNVFIIIERTRQKKTNRKTKFLRRSSHSYPHTHTHAYINEMQFSIAAQIRVNWTMCIVYWRRTKIRSVSMPMVPKFVFLHSPHLSLNSTNDLFLLLLHIVGTISTLSHIVCIILVWPMNRIEIVSSQWKIRIFDNHLYGVIMRSHCTYESKGNRDKMC